MAVVVKGGGEVGGYPANCPRSADFSQFWALSHWGFRAEFSKWPPNNVAPKNRWPHLKICNVCAPTCAGIQVCVCVAANWISVKNHLAAFSKPHQVRFECFERHCQRHGSANCSCGCVRCKSIPGGRQWALCVSRLDKRSPRTIAINDLDKR